MTKEETVGLMKLISGMVSEKKIIEKTDVDSWFFILEDESLIDMINAAKAFGKSGSTKFFPGVAELLSFKAKETKLTQLTEGEAWNLVSKAICRSSYYSEEEFAKLPEMVQKAVGSPSQLRAWAMTDSATIETVVASNFQRTFRSVLARENEINAMPIEVRKKIGELNQMALQKGESDGCRIQSIETREAE